MKRYDICIPKTYQKDGEEKTQWNRVGKFIRFEKEGGKESHILELHMFPETKFMLFEEKPRDNNEQSRESNVQSNQDESNGIPF